MSDLDFLTGRIDLDSAPSAAVYDEAPLWSAMFGLLMLEHVPLAGRQRVLDVGCGAGFPALELAARLGPSAQVHGVDTWTAGLARAAEKIAGRGVSNVFMHRASAAALPFADGSFDLIVSNLGVNNFDDPRGAMLECRRVARSGAVLAITTNLQGHMAEFYRVFDEVLAAAGDAEARRRLHVHVRHRATSEGIRALLLEAGFSMTREFGQQQRLRFASGTALLNHYFIRLGFLDAWKAVVPGREVEMFVRLRQRLDAIANGVGELALTIPMAYFEAVAA